MRLFKKRPVVSSCVCPALCLFVLLSACTAQNPSVRRQTPATQTGVAINEDGAILPSDDVEDAEASLAELEDSAPEEIAALNKMERWRSESALPRGKSGKPTGYAVSKYDFPVVLNDQVNYYLELFQGKQREMFSRWLDRSALYVPAIEKELAKAGLPRDLAYLPMIESGYNPSAVSRARASGLWQFMPQTGVRYNLTINSWVDERRDPEKATKAAVRYLSKLYNQFNNWHLAVAAYNTGEGKIAKAIKQKETTNFWDLSASDGIYTETKRYVPKLIAAIIIARNPTAYGFTPISSQKAPAYETVEVPGSTDLAAVASVAGIPLRQLRALNNELVRSLTPPSTSKKYALRVPVGSRQIIAANASKLQRRRAVGNVAYATHVVQKGDTLHAISRRYQVSMTDLLKSNRLRTSQLRAGQRLQIPVNVATLAARKAHREDRAVAQAQTKSYRVKKGDTLSDIAQKYGVSVAQLKAWNNLGPRGNVQAGKTLQVRGVAQSAKKAKSGNDSLLALTKTAKASPQKTAKQAPKALKSAPTIVATAKASHEKHLKAAANKTPQSKASRRSATSWYVVRNGDSVWAIAKKFSISVSDLKRWNRLSSNKLRVGNRLIVKRG